MINTVEIFPWNENLKTGIDIIDQQHQKLVQLINLLAQHIANKSDVLTLEKIFKQLTDYAYYHFETEEKIWHKYLDGDVWVEGHEKTHASFLTQVLEIKEHSNNGTLSEVVEDILSFLTHWLAFHILDSDKRMAKAVLAVQAGETIEQAKISSAEQMNGAMQVLIKTVLSMYDNLSVRTLSLMKEIAERERAQAKLKLTSKVIEGSLEAIFITDENYLLIDCNPAFESMCQSNYEQLLGQHINKLKPDLDEYPINEEIMDGLTEVGHWTGELWSDLGDGRKEPEWLTYSAIKSGKGDITNYVGVFSSMSQLIQRQQTLEQAANYDLLTDLPNRRLLADRLQQAIFLANRNKQLLAVCFLDLDGFKIINDTLGHAAGDILLIEVAQRLQNETRAVDTVARLGGDEFVLVLGGLSNDSVIMPLLEKLLSAIAEPINVGEDYARVTASIGVAIYPLHGDSTELILKKADKAMYQAKQAGKSCYRVFEPGVS